MRRVADSGQTRSDRANDTNSERQRAKSADSRRAESSPSHVQQELGNAGVARLADEAEANRVGGPREGTRDSAGSTAGSVGPAESARTAVAGPNGRALRRGSQATETSSAANRSARSPDGMCPRCRARASAGKPLDCPACEARLQGSETRTDRGGDGGPLDRGSPSEGNSGLTVTDPGDRYEREADVVADTVLGMSAPDTRRDGVGPSGHTSDGSASAPVTPVTGSTTSDASGVQRMCARCFTRPVAGTSLSCPECAKALQRKADGSTGAGAEPAVADELAAARGRGQPLPGGVRSFFESRFDRDFGDVRVHTGSDADRLAQSLNAKAFTTGSDVFFAGGEYRPRTAAGQRLLAHELTHVVQQTRPPKATTDRHSRSAGHRGDGVGSSPALAGTGPERTGRDADPAVAHRGSPEGEARVAASAVDAGVDVAVDRSVQDGAIQRYGFGDLRSDVGGLVSSAASSAYAAGETAVRAGGEAATAVAETGGTVVDRGRAFVEETIEKVGETGRAVVERVAPGLIEFLRNPGERIRDTLGSGLGRFVSGALDVLGVEDVSGLFGRLEATFNSAIETTTTVVSELANGIGGALGGTLSPFLSAVESQAVPMLEDVQKMVATILGGIESVGETLHGSVQSFVEGIGGEVAQGIAKAAAWAWELSEPLRNYAQLAWDWVMEQFGVAWESSDGVRTWLLDAAGSVWDSILSTIQPVLAQFDTAKEELSSLAAFKPVVKLTDAVGSLWDSLGWIRDNWNSSDVLVRARTALRERVLPAVLEGISNVTGLIGSVREWTVGAVETVASAFESAVGAIRGVPILEMAAGTTQYVYRQVTRLATWASSSFDSLMQWMSSTLGSLWSTLEPILDFLLQLRQVLTVPLRLPALLTGALWKRLPDQFKPPLITFLFDVLVRFVKQFPAFVSGLGPIAVLLKEAVLGFLEQLRDTGPQRKITVSNRIAELLQGSVEFAKGYLWGMLRGIWEGLTDPFRIIYMLGQVAVGATRLLASQIERLFPDDTDEQRREQARKQLEQADTKTEGVDEQIQSTTDSASSQSNATPGGVFEMLRSMWNSVLSKSNEIGGQIASALLDFIQLPDFELGDKLGWVSGTVLFEAVLYVLTAGSYAAVTASRPILKGILRFIDLGGELVGAVVKGLAKLKGPVSSALGQIGNIVRLVPGLGRAWDSAADALRSLFRVSDEAAPAGRGAGSGAEAAESGGARGTGELAESGGTGGTRQPSYSAETRAETWSVRDVDTGPQSGSTAAGRPGRESVEAVDDEATDVAETTVRNAMDEVHEFKRLPDGRLIRCSEACTELTTHVVERTKEIQKQVSPDSPAYARAQELQEQASELGARSLGEAGAATDEILDQARRLEQELSDLAKKQDGLPGGRPLGEGKSTASKGETEGGRGSSGADTGRVSRQGTEAPDIEAIGPERYQNDLISDENIPAVAFSKEKGLHNPISGDRPLKIEPDGAVVYADTGAPCRQCDPAYYFDETASRWKKKPDRLLPDQRVSKKTGGTKKDVSHRFNSYTEQKGDTIHETTEGVLGIPGEVMTHRNNPAQKRVSKGTGDDAGHRIANKFGAPGNESNLAQQNWIANRYGTFRDLEKRWGRKLKNGMQIRAKVTDVTRKGESRPFYRKVTWEETTIDGSTETKQLIFANMHTPKSRTKQDIPSTTSDSTADLIDITDYF
ncbi:DUF4157 domain-containing protein [Haloarcula sp. CBA1130]|uniref:eCIS core domain-containing protein n=1 Tax=unclassified Haloarcula TaxID=2624677 RepID=UPI0012477338|nr:MULTISPECIES: DUF4157 domain-containing protein [unclassified Haloarcula]KAA9396515.1 DUF4157 domain-containing protein [Haloarcula sp. CBA1130]KAA9397628.1 DUF4157 domain-containing protein [Haloarcula sp. CBA1129]